MEKSFYYPVSWTDVSYLKEALDTMEIPYAIEQGSLLSLAPGEVAFVFPDMHVRVYRHVRDLFGGDGKRYPD
ncbi:hypothetical protein ACAF76_008285 [Brevibacillus sp. TJ4]|uniref:hypothetical protein n=1 Tax=Brevibacillus sp. TJ4 TaxID=3234853 RepID=UPI0037CCD7C1